MGEKLFYKDSVNGIQKSYQDLMDDLRLKDSYYPYCREKSFYEIFKRIIHSILIDEEIVLLDGDFSESETRSLIGDLSLLDISVSRCIKDVSLQALQKALSRKDGNWRITLFTSGTTGLPKKITHTLPSITRFVKQSDRHHADIWGFAYNPTHMAGLQVFFQALLNFNPLIRLFGFSRDSVLRLIEDEHVTNISATPTFFRLLLPADRRLPMVSRITSGGEKFDASTLNALRQMFVNAKFTNVYASTEAGTLFASDGDVFTLKKDMNGLVKIERGELYIHRSLIGISESFRLDGDWYGTGDLITVVSEEPFSFKFVSRKNEMINVGGYKVNPTEVEEAIRTCPGVEDSYVFPKQNRILGNLICADVVCLDKAVTEKLLRGFLNGKLQEFKIPRIIRFVDKLEVTRTGKIARNKS